MVGNNAEERNTPKPGEDYRKINQLYKDKENLKLEIEKYQKEILDITEEHKKQIFLLKSLVIYIIYIYTYIYKYRQTQVAKGQRRAK